MMRIAWVLAFLCTASGCSDSDGDAPATSASAAAPSASTVAPPSASGPYRDEDLPVPPDYEEEAEKAVTPSNYKDKLAEIERELEPPAPSASAP
jgi:hypothetical protein